VSASTLAARSHLARRTDDMGAAVLVVPALLAAALSVISLAGRSLGFDEGATVAIVSQHGHALWHAIARDGGNMAGYYLLLHVLVGAFGNGPWVLRLPSVVFAALTPALLAAIARQLFDRRVAWLAGLFTAVSLPLVYWGQTARGYSGMLAFTCAGMLAFVAVARADEEHRPLRGPLLLYVVAMTLAAYCGFVAVLVIPAQLLVFARRRYALPRFLAALGALAALCVPLGILAARRGSGQLFWVPRPNHQVDTQVAQALASSGLQSTFHRVFITTPGWIATAVAVIALIGLVVRLRGRRDDPLGSWGMATILAWAIVPGLLCFAWSFISQPLFLQRNLFVSVPAVGLALAVGLADRRLPRWAAGLGIAIVLLIRVVPVAAAYGVSPEPWQPVADRVLANSRPGDCIAFYPEDGRNAFRWYVARASAADRAPRPVLPAGGWGVHPPYVELYPTLSPGRVAQVRASCRRLWFITSHEGQVTGPSVSVRHRVRWLRLRRRLEHAYGPARVHSFGYASTIRLELLRPRRHRRR
jgi:hypothetical protein